MENACDNDIGKIMDEIGEDRRMLPSLLSSVHLISCKDCETSQIIIEK